MKRLGLLDNKGTHEIRYDTGNLPSGIYFLRIDTETEHLTRKLLLVR